MNDINNRIQDVHIPSKNNGTQKTVNIANHFYTWKFGSINIRSGKEKSEGSKMYIIAKQVAQANLSFCCLQEVRHRNTGRKIISLDTGEEYLFIWCGQKRRRDAGVGILIRKSKVKKHVRKV